MSETASPMPPMGFSGRIFCPKCGTRIDLMPGAKYAACPECGHVVQLPERTPEQLEMERQAAAMAAEAIRQAEEATRQAREMARAQAEAEAAAREQAELLAREEAERRAREQAEAQARARAEAEAQARARAEAERLAQAQTARRRPAAGVEADGTIRDRATGYGLFRGAFPDGWRVVGTSLQRMGSSSRPYVPQVEMRDPDGGVIRFQLGEAGIRNSAYMKAMFAMYGGALVGVSTVNYADVPNPLQICDDTAAQYLTRVGAQNTQCLGQIDAGNLEQLQQRGFQYLQGMARQEGASVCDPLAASVLRVYSFEMGGVPWRLACYVLMYAAKDAGIMGAGLGIMAGGIADGIGKLFGGGRDEAPVQQPMEQRGAWERPAGPRWCLPDLAAYKKGGTIVWSVEQITVMATPADVFDERLEHDFLPLVDSLETHSDVLGLAVQVTRHEAAMVQQSTQNTIARQNAQFQAQQAAMRQQQAAFDSQLEQWHRNSDAHHQAFRERTNAQFNTPVGGGSPDYSEAIRGVNTFVRSDGTEVELDVRADVAYENQAGDVVGGPTGFDPGADWTQIPQR